MIEKGLFIEGSGEESSLTEDENHQLKEDLQKVTKMVKWFSHKQIPD